MLGFRGVLEIVAVGVIAIGIGATTGAQVHSGDTNQDYVINLSELLRVIQFFNSAGFQCADPPGSTEDGYAPDAGEAVKVGNRIIGLS